jgi:hypothetical protein
MKAMSAFIASLHCFWLERFVSKKVGGQDSGLR